MIENELTLQRELFVMIMKSSFNTVVLLASVITVDVFSPSNARAQHMNDPDGPCWETGSTVDTAQCFDIAYKQADTELNVTYRQIMAALDEAEKASLRSAQRAWINYRDKACEAEAAPYRNRTAKGAARLACLEAATRSRTAFLRKGLMWQVKNL